MAGEIQSAFDSVYQDGPSTRPSEPDKSRIRTEIGGKLQDEIDGLRSLATSGAQWKEPVRVASGGNYSIASGLENGDVIDSVTLATGDRVLLFGQTTPSQNGIYVVAASGAASRASDADTAAEVLAMATYVRSGTVNGGKQFICTAASPIVIGTTALPFQQLSQIVNPGFASSTQAVAGQADDLAMSPSTNKAVLTDRLGTASGAETVRTGSVIVLTDRKGRIGLDIRSDGSAYLASGKVLTETSGKSEIDVRQRLYVGGYGGSVSLNDDGGMDAELDTYFPPFQLMMNVGLESYSGSSGGTSPATGTIGFVPGALRERSILPVMRAMKYGPLASSTLVVDLAGRLATPGQLVNLTEGTDAFNNLIHNVQTVFSEAVSEGRTAGVAAMLWQGGDADWRASLTADAYLSAFAEFDLAERTALSFATKGNQYPRLVRQIASHGYWASSYAREVVLAQGRAGEIANNFVVGPSYIFQHVIGATIGWGDAYLLAPHGYRHAGMFDAKAWSRWAVTGTWRPCEMIEARLYERKLIEVLVHVPVAPLQISATTVAEVADGNHGLEVWIGSTRQTISSVAIVDDGTSSGVGRIVITMASTLPAGEVEVWSARTSDIAGTVSGDYRVGCQPGPQSGPRTTICDSDSVDGETWANALKTPDGNAYDLRNYLTVRKVIAQ